LTYKPSKVLIIGSGDFTLTLEPSPIEGEGKMDSRLRGNDGGKRRGGLLRRRLAMTEKQKEHSLDL